jgi:hypothetical protein
VDSKYESMENLKAKKRISIFSSNKFSRKDTLEQSQHESDNGVIKLFESDKDNETESEEEETSQDIGNEGWENVFNDLTKLKKSNRISH